MILPQITPRITSLHNHLLPRDRATRKRQLIAGTAPRRLRLSGDAHGGPAVRSSLVDGPRGLIRTHVCGPA